MNIFTNDDIDFSKDFYTYLSDSYNKHTQEKKLKEHNNKIIKENISKLEDCIKQNLKNDNTQPYDKTFICGSFRYLDKNNNNQKEKDETINKKQFEKPMSKINLSENNINKDDVEFISGFPIRGLCGVLRCKSNILPKNTYAYFDQHLIIRMSNIDNSVDNPVDDSSDNSVYDVIKNIYYN